MSVQLLLQQRFAQLTPALQRAARFVLDHPNDVVVKSMRALAEQASVPPATFVRLAGQLGFSGWPTLKAAVVTELGLGSNPYGERARGLLVRGHDKSLVGEMFEAQRQNLDLTESRCAATLGKAAALIAGARAVHVAGFRASFPIAWSFVYVYRLFRDSVHLIDGLAGNLEMNLRLLNARDAVLVVGFAPYSSESMTVIRAARDAGCKVVALTDSSVSPLALAADVAVLFSASSPSFFPSISAGMATAEALTAMLAARAGAAGVAHLERAEVQLHSTGAYLAAPASARQPRRRNV